jgi:hypothetical protein
MVNKEDVALWIKFIGLYWTRILTFGFYKDSSKCLDQPSNYRPFKKLLVRGVNRKYLILWGDPDVDGRIILRWIFRK